MSMLGWIIIITAVAGVGGTWLGGVVGALFNKDSSKIVSLLLSFAGGVMLAVVCFDLITDAIAPAESGAANLFIVIAAIIAGYIVVSLLNLAIDRAANHEVKHIDPDHPRTADDLDELIHSDHLEEHRRRGGSYELFIGGIVMACAIALHNLPEGMVIGAAYAGSETSVLAFGGALAIAVVIGLHNVPEGMAISVPLISGGMRPGRAILVTAASGAPTIIGAVIGYYVGAASRLGLSLSLGFASGAMLYVVFGELLPESILMWRSKLPAVAVLGGIIVGLVIIFI